MTAILRLRTLELDVRLSVEDDRLSAVLARALSDLTVPATGGHPVHEVQVHGRGPWDVFSTEFTASAATVEEALTRTLTAVNLTTVARTPLLAFHAAVVTRGGAALVVPARSGAGKSTLTACLLQQGWAYVSDETLALDWSSGRLVAYPRPMALSAWSCTAAGGITGLAGEGETVVTARDLGAPVDLEPGSVRAVVLLRRSTATEPQLGRVDRNDGLHELLRRGFTHHRDGGTALRRAAELLTESEVLELRLGDPVSGARLLTRHVDAS